MVEIDNMEHESRLEEVHQAEVHELYILFHIRANE
jgi:hypothetical protein